MIFQPFENAIRNKAVKPVGQDIGRDTQLSLQRVETADAEEAFPDDHEAPTVPNDFQGAGDGAWAPPVEYVPVNLPALLCGLQDWCCASAGPIAIGDGPYIDFSIATRARDDRMAYTTALIMHELQRRRPGACKPFIAKTHKGEHDRIKVYTHHSEAVFEPERFAGAFNTAEYALDGEFSKALS